VRKTLRPKKGRSGTHWKPTRGNTSKEETSLGQDTPDTDSLFRLETLLLRLDVRKVSTKSIKSSLEWEAAKGPTRSSNQAAPSE